VIGGEQESFALCYTIHVVVSLDGIGCVPFGIFFAVYMRLPSSPVVAEFSDSHGGSVYVLDGNTWFFPTAATCGATASAAELRFTHDHHVVDRIGASGVCVGCTRIIGADPRLNGIASPIVHSTCDGAVW